MKKSRKKESPLDAIPKWLTILFVAVVPLLVRVSMVQYNMAKYDWYPNETVFFDSYSIFKSKVIITIGSIALGWLIFQQLKNKLLSIKDPVVIVTLILTFFTLLSFITSVDKGMASRGYLGRYEGVWVWLSYFAVFLAVYSHKWNKKELNQVILSFVISNTILSIIGIFQYWGIEIPHHELLRPFTTAFNMQGITFTADYSINYKVIVQTLYHYNYVGFLAALSLPFVFSLVLHEHKMLYKGFYGVLGAAILFNLLGSSARGGLIGVAVSIPFIIALNYKLIFKHKKVAISAFLILIVIFVGFETLSNGFVTKRLQSIFTQVGAPNKLQSIEIEDNKITVFLENRKFDLLVTDTTGSGWVIEYYLDNEPTETTGVDEENKVRFEDPFLNHVKNYMVRTENDFFLALDLYGTPWYFGYQNGELMFRNPYSNYVSIISPETIGFEGREQLGSARGYIWSRALPLILNKPITGYGTDTFALAFPQHDYVGKYNAYNTNNMVVDKAHNLYIQVAINSGLIALLAYFSYFIILAKRIFSSIKTNGFNFTSIYQSAFITGLIAYFIASFFNDSTVHVSPVFWMFLALAFVATKKNREE
jgi:hypothetical protein